MDIRVDLLKDETIIYADKRNKRPINFRNNNLNVINEDFFCPFCKANEEISGEIISKNKLGSRIIKNMYPILEDDYGVHDVAIESYEHNLHFKDMSTEVVFYFLKLIQGRMRELQDNNLKHIQVFKNCGAKSGASLIHQHWQIIGSKFVPKNIKNVAEQFEKYHANLSSCYLCDNYDILKVYSDDNMVMGIPKAYMTTKAFRIYAKKHITSFIDIDENCLKSLANMLIRAINIINDFDNGCSFNILFFENSIKSKNDKFHFFVEVFSRKGTFGGFELSSGTYVNDMLPEQFYEEVMEKMEV